MITFDGVDINSIAPVKIEDIRVSPVALNPLARDRSVSGGAQFVRTRDGTRTVAITFALLVDDPMQRAAYFNALRNWEKRDTEYRLEIAYMPDVFLEAVCTGFPEPSVRQWWESKLRLTFTCFDNPYWTSKAERTAECGSEFIVGGDAPPLMQIVRTLAASALNQSYSDGSKTMTFNTIPAGSLIIDLNRQTAAVNGSSIMQNYTFTSKFLIPRTGAQTIAGSGTIKYRERWV